VPSPGRPTLAAPRPTAVEKASKLRVLFGHQSVGENLITGLKERLSPMRITGVTDTPQSASLRVSPTLRGPTKPPSPRPQASRKRWISRRPGRVAVQFCYVDFSPPPTWTRCSPSISAPCRAEGSIPAVVFGHITCRSPGRRRAQGLVQRKLGRVPGASARTCDGMPSTRSSGELPEGADLRPRPDRGHPSDGALDTYLSTASGAKLRSDFSDDGGHLNAAVGRRWRWGSSATSPRSRSGPRRKRARASRVAAAHHAVARGESADDGHRGRHEEVELHRQHAHVSNDCSGR